MEVVPGHLETEMIHFNQSDLIDRLILRQWYQQVSGWNCLLIGNSSAHAFHVLHRYTTKRHRMNRNIFSACCYWLTCMWTSLQQHWSSHAGEIDKDTYTVDLLMFFFFFFKKSNTGNGHPVLGPVTCDVTAPSANWCNCKNPAFSHC